MSLWNAGGKYVTFLSKGWKLVLRFSQARLGQHTRKSECGKHRNGERREAWRSKWGQGGPDLSEAVNGGSRSPRNHEALAHTWEAFYFLKKAWHFFTIFIQTSDLNNHDRTLEVYCIPPEHQEYIVYIIQEYKNCYKKLIINHRIENVWKLLLSTTPGRGAPFLMLRFWRQNEVPISFLHEPFTVWKFMLISSQNFSGHYFSTLYPALTQQTVKQSHLISSIL